MSIDQGGRPDSPAGRGARRFLVLGLAGAALIALVVAIGVGVVVRKATKEVVAGAAVPAVNEGADYGPAGVTADGAVLVGDPGAKVVVRLVADLQCPACKAFEKANATVLESAVRDGGAVEYSVISFLDRASSTEYSSRAGNASYCVAAAGTSNYQAWLASMFEKQPAEGGGGLPDSTLIDIAEAAGYTDPAVAQCITDRKYDSYLRDKTQEVLGSGVSATPTVFVNGNKLDSRQLGSGGLAAAIAAAK